MNKSIREKADTIATLRFVSVHLMETLARWVPTTPELELKALFGRHIWDLAQHADALGRRTAELKAALHYSRPPCAVYQTILNTMTELENSGDRVVCFYDGMLPDLTSKYGYYLKESDPLLDEPSVRIIERVLPDLSRMRDEARSTRDERPDIQPTQGDNTNLGSLLSAALQDFVDYRATRNPETVSQ